MLVESRLQIEPTALAVRAIGGWLHDAAAHVDPAAAAALLSRAELAVHEACMNVIDHAELPSGSSLTLDLELTYGALTVRVSDPGDPFDLDAVPVPDPQALEPRGYGVKIIRGLVSELSYRRVGSTNELTLRFDIGTDE